jgi:hypothetical protein
MYDPHSGGATIPDRVKWSTEQRLRACAEANLAGKYTRLDIRFRGQFCYVDAYQEPDVPPGFPGPDWPETREEYIERLRTTPIHLFRLRYFGDQDRWSMAMYTYSGDRYEPSVFGSGGMMGTPEEALLLIGQFYLT